MVRGDRVVMTYPETDIIINRVKTAVGLKLSQTGYIDGYCYDSDEWILKDVWCAPKSNCYYAHIKVNSDDEAIREALYKIDANDEEWGTERGELPTHVGRWAVDKPDDCQKI